MTGTILPWTFSIFKFCGFWRPRSLDSARNWSRLSYDLFTGFMVAMVFSLSVCGVVDIALTMSTRNIEQLTENAFIMLTLMNALCKGTNVLIRRGDVFEAERVLLSGPCTARDSDEIYIQNYFDRMAKSTTTYYMILIEVSVCLVTLRSLMDFYESASLPFRMWLPYDHTSSAVLLWGSYIYETATNVTCSLLHVASESLVSGLMIQICAQLEILKYRLRQVSQEYLQNHAVLIECIQHHKLIFEFAENSNRMFKPIFIVQFVVSTIVICTSVYLLASMDIASVQFVSVFSYVISILVQLFLYCWHGNEVMLKSLDISDAAYETDWTTLDSRDRKILLTMMIRSMTPIKFTSSFLVTLSIDSYMNILKMSYSAFNVLQQSSVS